MKRLPLPSFAVRSILEKCIDSLHAGPLKDKLGLVIDDVVAAEANYLERGAQTALFTIAQADNVAGSVTRAEMERVYSGTFVKSVRTRPIYDAIKQSPENDICPLCVQRTVSTLDHYLAQARHAPLTVVPFNLVPACSECNKTKLATQPETAAEQTFHPYFDDFDDHRWLFATVEETTPARLVFQVTPPAEWPELTHQRIARHFQLFGLGALYASHSAAELTNIRHFLSLLAKRGTPETIKTFLLEQAESSYNAHKNSWRTAAYFAWSESDWFCERGFAGV
jgi:hypothetical protein